ncbi:type II toxin-antitoxin system PrlF family antitoxin [Neisseria elongata]|jgi:ydcA|uniref:type II toxin-antitoxin system PrlF family antitoxin n=1 Tax=Neisseria elongata TaxID=495 RepID=UPI000D316BBF|nr:type II toxin-antitoxin system PrlF family antitoxin [Neisseria elongata]
MKIIFDAVSTMTSKNQTTIPKSVRKALGLEKQDRILFSVLDSGKVLLEKNNTDDEEFEHDPVVGKFLYFLENSMTKNPDSIKPTSQSRFNRLRQLTRETDTTKD